MSKIKLIDKKGFFRYKEVEGQIYNPFSVRVPDYEGHTYLWFSFESVSPGGIYIFRESENQRLIQRREALPPLGAPPPRIRRHDIGRNPEQAFMYTYQAQAQAQAQVQANPYLTPNTVDQIIVNEYANGRRGINPQTI